MDPERNMEAVKKNPLPSDSNMEPVEFHAKEDTEVQPGGSSLNAEKSLDAPSAMVLLEVVEEGMKSGNYFWALKLIQMSFASMSTVSRVFGLSDGDCVDFTSVGKFYDLIGQMNNDSIVQELMDLVDHLLKGFLTKIETPMPWSDIMETAVQPLLVILENPFFMEPEHHSVMLTLCRVCSELPPEPKKILSLELNKYSKERLEQLVALVQQFCTISIYESSITGEAVTYAAKSLEILFDSNEQVKRLPHSAFYNDAVNNEDFDVKEDFLRWQQPSSFSVCRYPFLYDPESKSKILQLDSKSQMNHQFEDALFRSFFMGGSLPFNVICVRRDNIIEDTIAQIQRKLHDLKKPLKVKFLGEDGVDEGGVQKEFFQLIVREIFDPKYGMFHHNDETHQFWFNSFSLEMGMEYELIGMVLGLAIYNGHILEFRFPNVIYKKLLGKSINFDDLKEVNPGLGKGLEDLLRFEGDVQSVFERSFQVSVADMFGQISTFDLKENGGEIPVTEENRQEYVDLCVQFYLNTSISKPFESFLKGFQRVCGGPALQMFQPEELELLVCGSPVLDFDALEKFTRYDDGYTKDSPIIKQFWEIVHSFSEEQKKKLLFFTTGSDRVPIKGLANLPFVISRNGPDSDRLPTSHTCFNHLLLPEYSSREKMKDRLLLAINNAEGFGLR